MVGQDHADDVEDPDDVPSEEDTEEGADPMSFFKTSDETEDPRSDGDDAEDQADEPRPTEIIPFRFSGHDEFLLYFLLLSNCFLNIFFCNYSLTV